MQKIYFLYLMLLNFFSHARLRLVIFAHAPYQCRVKTVAPSPPKSSKWGSLISTDIWVVSRFFDSLAALFQGMYPEISSGGAPQMFVRTEINVHKDLADFKIPPGPSTNNFFRTRGPSLPGPFTPLVKGTRKWS